MKIVNVSMSNWNSKLAEMARLNAVAGHWVREKGKSIELVDGIKMKPSYLSQQGFSPLTMDKVVQITKRVAKQVDENTRANMGLSIGKMSLWEQQSSETFFVNKAYTVWNRVYNLFTRCEFKTGAEIARGYARHLLQFDKLSSAMQRAIVRNFREPSAKVRNWSEEIALSPAAREHGFNMFFDALQLQRGHISRRKEDELALSFWLFTNASATRCHQAAGGKIKIDI